MSFLAQALHLASLGFHVFPLVPRSKFPLIESFPTEASTDEKRIRQWWWDDILGIEQPFNIGISTSRFRDKEALLAVDIDNKGEKKGDDEIFQLELQGRDFPLTYEQTTPTGGRHLLYRVDHALKQGVRILGSTGIDSRSRGGFVVAAGSEVEAGRYRAVPRDVSRAPAWLVSACGDAPAPERHSEKRIEGVDKSAATSRAIRYLLNEAKLSIEGDGGDQSSFVTAARVKDLGVSEAECFTLMFELWNPRCEPPWAPEELKTKVRNAYRYGVEPQGAAAPEADFKVVLVSTHEAVSGGKAAETLAEKKLHPFLELNREYAFVLVGSGCHILWETTDHNNQFLLKHLDLQSFHLHLAAKKMAIGNGQKQVSKLWLESDARRSYNGLCFMPGLPCPPKFYNQWLGFSVFPLKDGEETTRQAQESLDAFLDHARVNVCKGDEKLYHWLIGYFAHLVQKPWEKPLVALVFRGSKGVGKNALIDRVGSLLGPHYLLTSNSRYLVGNFNGHLENCLLFALDEAFWSGEKRAEGTLKDLITGQKHIIERKGHESYPIENCTRVVIIGNEDWLVPASHDERRFAVFDVGEGRKQDRSFFHDMRVGMENGGYRLLLRYLMDYSLEGLDLNDAPRTSALLDQKNRSLEPFHQWWLDCLTEGMIIASEFGSEWPENASKERVRNAFRRYVRDRQITSRIPEDRLIGKLLKKCLPSLVTDQKTRQGSEWVNVYRLPGLTQARLEWQNFIGHEVSW